MYEARTDREQAAGGDPIRIGDTCAWRARKPGDSTVQLARPTARGAYV
jgi:hypothetical protein